MRFTAEKRSPSANRCDVIFFKSAFALVLCHDGWKKMSIMEWIIAFMLNPKSHDTEGEESEKQEGREGKSRFDCKAGFLSGSSPLSLYLFIFSEHKYPYPLSFLPLCICLSLFHALTLSVHTHTQTHKPARAHTHAHTCHET